MKQSKNFTKTLKNAPTDEVSKNAQLLIKAGFVHKEMAGVYSLLPLGMKVVENIKKIVREEMNSLDAQEMIMSSLQPKNSWEQTGRWSDDIVDVWFKSSLKSGSEIGFGWSHEEPITEMMKNHISSFRHLPAYVYQFQNKFRNETRAKSGLMRGREFVMKDMYSFNLEEKDHTKFYNDTIEAYNRVFERLGIGEDTFITFADGGSFTEYSHEFQTICDAGEDEIYINRKKKIAINEEVYNEQTLKKLNVKASDLQKVKTAEVGNIFNFGTSKCEQMSFFYKDQNEKNIPVFLGSYGIGITRLMGVIAEKNSDEKGLVWDKNIAPYSVCIINIGKEKEAEEIYKSLKKEGVNVLWDDREKRPGERFGDCDLLGIPYRVVISEKSLENGGVEFKKRTDAEGKIINIDDIVKNIL